MLTQILFWICAVVIVTKTEVSASNSVNCSNLFVVVEAQQSVDQCAALEINTLTDTLFNDPSYEPKLAPFLYNNNSKAVTITMSIYVAGLTSVLESSMDFIINGFRRLEWVDARLRFAEKGFSIKDLYLDRRYKGTVWRPDIFVANQIENNINEYDSDYAIHIHEDGTVLTSERFSVKVGCSMNLVKFPLDTQNCSVIFESYAYRDDKLTFKWEPKKPLEQSDIQLEDFTLKPMKTDTCYGTYDTGNFPCLSLKLILERKMGYYIINTYIPGTLIVVISWIGFWMNHENSASRVSLAVTCVLTMVTQSIASRQNIPQVSYIKAIDVWTSTCLVFVFMVLLEYALVSVAATREKLVEVPEKSAESNERRGTSMRKGDGARCNTEYIVDPYGNSTATAMDSLSKKIFPALFILFIFIYWLVYNL